MKPFYLTFIFFLFFFGCTKQSTIYPIDRTIPEQRNFYMGFSTFAYDTTNEAQSVVYNDISINGDIVLFQFDEGVPWQEALYDQPLPEKLKLRIKDAITLSERGKKIFLTVSPTDLSRQHLALYWSNNGENLPLPEPWNNYAFDKQEVITAYIKYCKYLINMIKPDYFAYAIDINEGFMENTDNFNSFIKFASAVYDSLKETFPALPVFMTFRDQAMNKNKAELMTITKFLLPYSDWIAVNTYPFWQYYYLRQDANPELFPNNWLEEMRNLAPDKPFAVASTGFCAEDLNLPSYDVRIKGSEQWQADYVQKVLIESYKLKAKFVIWFIFRDYDLLYSRFPNASDLFLFLKDTGLEDGQGKQRPSYYVWQQWFKLNIEQL